MIVLYVALALITVVVTALVLLRLLDWRADRAEWTRLAALQPADPPLYAPSMVADLPEPARRFFNFAINPGTPLYRVAALRMGGQFSLGSKEAPNYQPMNAEQILAAPEGFVWRMRLKNALGVSGSDAGRWTRFRILGLVPVARLGGNPDHTRSAFGRYVAEAVFWTPAAVLPGIGVQWEPVDVDTARVTVSSGELSQAVEVRVDPEGRPTQVSFMRWSNANPDKTFRLQPFGGILSDFRKVEGFHLPFRVDAGNGFGTDDYFVFFKAEINEIRYIQGVR
ncbi:DUF6544 family protein [Marinimicrobium agarilyticum]|uniref:DUF6544 family protein n=1 Tax=Marinimicrobium agarilyticum TaxID=306546 RepID=UPI0003F623D5|nr:DUF6544 family protein [Marinimicrobium agarilyticum]